MANKYRGVSFTGGNTANLTVGTGIQPSRPIGEGRGPIRTAMANDSFKYSLSDRMSARRADKAMAGDTMPTATANPQAAAQTMQPSQSRLDTSPTPGLDAQQQNPIRYATKQSRMDEQTAATAKSTLSGAFGQRAQKKAENLEGRKALYKDMQVSPIQPKYRTDLTKRATELGVDNPGFQRGIDRIATGNASSLPAMAIASKPSWKTMTAPPPLTADIGKADLIPNKRKPGM